jgi:hypothetical protein
MAIFTEKEKIVKFIWITKDTKWSKQELQSWKNDPPCFQGITKLHIISESMVLPGTDAHRPKV